MVKGYKASVVSLLFVLDMVYMEALILFFCLCMMYVWNVWFDAVGWITGRMFSM